jgi:type I restriction enzyme M protein
VKPDHKGIFRYVTQNDEDDTLPLEEAIVLLKEAEKQRSDTDEKLKEILEKLRGVGENG